MGILEVFEKIEHVFFWLIHRRWKLGEPAGVPVFVCGSLLIPIEMMFILCAFEYYLKRDFYAVATSFLSYFGTVSMIFMLVTLHEFGHITAARFYGVKTHKIDLSIFGGAAELETTLFDGPFPTFIVAIAGPMVNAVLAGVCCLLPERWQLINFIQYNLVLCCFNLIPIYPMDGGRVVEAMFLMVTGKDRIPHVRALKWTRQVASVAALSCAGIAIYFNYWWPLLLVAVMYLVGREAIQHGIELATEKNGADCVKELRTMAGDNEELFRAMLVKFYVLCDLLEKYPPNTAGLKERADAFYEQFHAALQTVPAYARLLLEHYEECRDDEARAAVVRTWVTRQAKILGVTA